MGGLGFQVDEYDEDDHMNRLYDLENKIAYTQDEESKAKLIAKRDEMHKLGHAAMGDKMAALGKHRGKLVKALNESWKDLTNNVIEPLMKTREVGEISGTRALHREIMDSGNVVNPMGDLNGDGNGFGYVSYHPEMFNPEHKEEGGPLSINRLIQSKGSSLMELAMD